MPMLNLSDWPEVCGWYTCDDCGRACCDFDPSPWQNHQARFDAFMALKLELAHIASGDTMICDTCMRAVMNGLEDRPAPSARWTPPAPTLSPRQIADGEDWLDGI